MNLKLEIARIVYVVGFILIPLIVSPFSLTPFTLSKSFFLAILVLISFVFFIISKPLEYKLPHPALGMLIFLEVLSVKDLNSLWYLFPRYSETFLISILVYFFIFLGLNLFKDFNLDKLLIYSCTLVISVSLIDLFNSSRVSSTLGQANFLGIFLVLGLLTFIKNYYEREGYNTFFSIFFVLLSITFIIKSASIVSLLAFVIGIFLLKDKVKNVNLKFLILLVALCSIIFISFGNILKAKILDIYNQINNPKETVISDSFIIRQKIWSNSINILYKNPEMMFLGYGSGNFEYLFEKNRGEVLEGTSEATLLFDKPHNYYIEILFNYGFFYLIILTYLLLVSIKKNNNNFLLIPIIIFLFFNWLDISLKVLLFTIIFTRLESYKIMSNSILNFSFTLSILLISIFFGILFYKDTKFFLKDDNYIFSMNKEDILNLKTKNPVILVSSFEYLDKEDRREIFDFLIKNFPENKAILFQLNKLL